MNEPGATYLYFQQVIPANTFVVHLVICVISVTALLVFDESEAVDPISI